MCAYLADYGIRTTAIRAGRGSQSPSTIFNPDEVLGGGHKSPVRPPYVTLDDHTLYIWSQHGGYTLTLLDDNDTVVYQTYVAAGVQFCALPPTLSGSYTLQLSNDTYLFTGMVVL